MKGNMVLEDNESALEGYPCVRAGNHSILRGAEMSKGSFQTIN